MWSHDYCTVCDKQCSPGSMYCSENCRQSEQLSPVPAVSAFASIPSSTTATDSLIYNYNAKRHSLSMPMPSAHNYNSSTTAANTSPTLSIASRESQQPSPMLLASQSGNEDVDYFTLNQNTLSLNYKKWLSSY